MSAPPKIKAKDGIKIISENRKARHNYFIEETYEAGIVLQGTEVKALREGKANIGEAYGIFKGRELFLLNAHIPPYAMGNRQNHEPLRTRKLLLNRSELDKLLAKVEAKGYTLVPLKLYFSKGIAKCSVGLGKGKKLHDKRETSKNRDAEREMDRARKHDR